MYPRRLVACVNYPWPGCGYTPFERCGISVRTLILSWDILYRVVFVKIRALLAASILLLVSGQVSAALIGMNSSGSIYSTDLDSGVTNQLFTSPLWGNSGLAIVSPVPAPPALLLFGTGLLGLIGVSKRRKAA